MLPRRNLDGYAKQGVLAVLSHRAIVAGDRCQGNNKVRVLPQGHGGRQATLPMSYCVPPGNADTGEDGVSTAGSTGNERGGDRDGLCGALNLAEELMMSSQQGR